MLDEASAVGEEVLRHWGPIFVARPVDVEAQAEFLDCAQRQDASAGWEWQRDA